MIKLLWSPTKNQIEDSQAWEFIQKVNKKFNISLENFHDLYKLTIVTPITIKKSPKMVCQFKDCL